jgi:hypothetical protein
LIEKNQTFFVFGLVYQSQTFGVNVNRLTKNTRRDPIAGTPLYRCVPCRVQALR